MADIETARRIRLALDALAWTDSQLASATGMTKQSIHQIMTGVRSGRARMADIARVLQVPLEWLTTGANPPAWAQRSSEKPQALAEGRSPYSPLSEFEMAKTLVEQGMEINRLWERIRGLDDGLKVALGTVRELEEKHESLRSLAAESEARYRSLANAVAVLEGQRAGHRRSTRVDEP